MNKCAASRLLLLLFVALTSGGCADTPRSSPACDHPLSVPPSIKETKSMNTSWEQEFGLVQGAKAGGLSFWRASWLSMRRE